MSEPLDLRERRELCDLMLELGPDAPTLCEGWTAFDLAAHLVVRERNPLSGPGNAFGGKAADFNEKLMAREKRHGFEEVVARARRIPFGVWSVPPVRYAFNLVENIIHHEDLRRPNGLGPRSDRDDLQEAAWGRTKQMGGMAVGRRKISPVALELQATGLVDGTTRAGKGDRTVRVVGEPVELLMFLYGRRGPVVELDGEPADVELVGAKFGG